MHDEAERASRKAMAVIAPETNETSEVRIFLKIIFYLIIRKMIRSVMVLMKMQQK
jgi:hypothetical protein